MSSSNGEDNSVTLGESETSLSTVGERSFLILNDSGDSQCQVEVEVLQEDSSSILEGIPISPADNLVTQVSRSSSFKFIKLLTSLLPLDYHAKDTSIYIIYV